MADKLPSWLYTPLKVALTLALFIPLILWGKEYLDAPLKSDIAWLKQELEKVKKAEEKKISELEGIIDSNKTKTAMPDKHIEDTYLSGIDVSHFQGSINWSLVAKNQVAFAYIKATNGESFIDPRFHANWVEARIANLYRGAYHFFLAADDPKKQAEHFVKAVGSLYRKHDLPPMLDVETSDHTSNKILQERALVWLETVERELGVRPILYTDNGFADGVLTDRRFSRFPLWIAEYSEKVKQLPKPWKRSGWVIWQHSNKGRIEGIKGDVDLDRFNGDLDELKEFIEESHLGKEPEI